MNYDGLCKNALGLDPLIRFTGVMDDSGKLLVDIYKEGVGKLLNSNEIGMSFHYTLQRRENVANLSYKIGNEKYTITEYDKVTLICIPLNEKELFLLSAEPSADYFGIINKINSLMKNHSG